MVRALSQPPSDVPTQRPGSSQSHGSGSRPSSSLLHSQRGSSLQSNAPLQSQGSRKINHYIPGHKRNSSLGQLDANNPSCLPSQLQQYAPVEKQRNPPSPQMSVPRKYNLEAGLAQFELSPSTSDSGASFELLTLPDFSSLSTCDTSVPETDPEPSSEDQSHAALPVFLDPGSQMIYTPPQCGSKPRRDSIPTPMVNLMQSALHGFSSGDLSSMLNEVARENKKLNQCLLESNQCMQKMEEERLNYLEGFHRAREIIKVKKEGTDTNTVVDTKVSRKESKKEKKADKKSESKNGVENNVSLLNLSEQLDVAEEAQAQLSQDLQRVTQEKLETQNQLASVNLEYETLKTNVEQLTRDKWEITQVNNDLQQRLQQTVALAHMQAEGNQSRLQEEVGRMLFQLEEERKVTANLSKNLELERRKVESLEQKAKGNSSTRGSSKGERRRSSLLPDEVRDNETRLAQSMELYRQRCDNLGTSLAGCQAKLEDERYCGDLTTEVNKLRKLLTEEKKKVGGETARLGETHALFEQIYMDYTSTIESVKQAQHEKRMKSQQQSVLNNIAESNMRDNVDSMTARLMQAEEALAQERRDNHQSKERLAQAALDLEALPLLQAQVEVYQSDFNAERMARERIAGEKADLEEQMRKAGVQKTPAAVQGGGQAGGFDGFQQRGGGGGAGQGNQYGQGAKAGPFETQRTNGGNAVRERVNSHAGREQQYDNIPRTVNIRPDPELEAEPAEVFMCPKCNREFRNTTLLTRHVNDCLDRDF